jgi:hypothetical protein
MSQQLVPDTPPSLLYSNSGVVGPLTFTFTSPFSFGTAGVYDYVNAAIGSYIGTAVYLMILGPTVGEWPVGGSITITGPGGVDLNPRLRIGGPAAGDGGSVTVYSITKAVFVLTTGVQYTLTPSAGFPPFSVQIFALDNRPLLNPAAQAAP